jgi:hypothetical protein
MRFARTSFTRLQETHMPRALKTAAPPPATKARAPAAKLGAPKTPVRKLATAKPAPPPPSLHTPPVIGELPVGLSRLPKTLAGVADLFLEIRTARLAIDKEAAALKSQETYLETFLIDALEKAKTEGVSGASVTVVIDRKKKPIVENWDLFYAYVKKTGAFDLLQRRLGEKAVEERWADKKAIPGVGSWDYKKLSVSKRK